MASNMTLQTSTSGNIFGKIGHFFKHVLIAVASWFEKDFGDAAHTFAVGAEALLETQLGQIAMVAVQQAAGLETNQEKWSTAGEAILQASKQAGLSVTDSLKNMLIELAVQKLKGAWGPAPATN